MDTTSLTYLNNTEDLQNNLRIKSNADQDDTAKEDNSSGLTASGDTVSISEEGKRLSGQAVQQIESDDEDDSTDIEDQIESLEEQIKTIQEQIEEIEDDESLGQEEKQRNIQALNAQLMQLEQQLAELEAEQGSSSSGGTSAEGFASSLT